MAMAAIRDLIVDDRLRGIFRVNRRVFTDPEILEHERREFSIAAGSTPVMNRRSEIAATSSLEGRAGAR